MNTKIILKKGILSLSVLFLTAALQLNADEPNPFAREGNPFAPEMLNRTEQELNNKNQPPAFNPFQAHPTTEQRAPFGREEHRENRPEREFGMHTRLEEEHGHGRRPEMAHNPFEAQREHSSTARHTETIPTLHVTPGHSVTLQPLPLKGNEQIEKYVIQDHLYQKYLSSTGNYQTHERNYLLKIPATVHSGTFTIFKAPAVNNPDHFEPAYHVEIKGEPHHLAIDGTQYNEPQKVSALEALDQLEEKYLTMITTQFKTFTKEAKLLMVEAQKNGESLETAPLPARVESKPQVKLRINETHIATSFAGGSVQSSNPTIASANLEFEGTKEKASWKVVITGHKPGEAVITYSTGTESFLQPVVVENIVMEVKKEEPKAHTMPEHKAPVEHEHHTFPELKTSPFALHEEHETPAQEAEKREEMMQKELHPTLMMPKTEEHETPFFEEQKQHEEALEHHEPEAMFEGTHPENPFEEEKEHALAQREELEK